MTRAAQLYVRAIDTHSEEIAVTTAPASTPSAPTTSARSDSVPQLLLPGQAAAPEGPIDMTVMYVMHHAFRRDLRRFRAAVPATPIADTATWSALARRWNLMVRVLEHHHRGEDDGVWPALTPRVPEAAVLLDAMQGQHHQLDAALDAVGTGFARLWMPRGPGDPSRARDRLVEDLATTSALLDHHLAEEEREAIPLIQQHLGTDEWRTIERAHFERRPPAALTVLVPWFFEDVPDELVPTVLSSVGAPVGALWRVTRGWFRWNERRTFRYATD